MNYAIIDVDCTVVDSPAAWLHWLNRMTGRNETPKSLGCDYNIGKHFEADLAKFNISPFDYWRSDIIYDTLYPLPFAQEALQLLKANGYKILFVSHIKGNHNKSKYNFLKRYFCEVMDGYLGTKEKWFVHSGKDGDIIIDDRHKFLNSHPATHKLLFDSPWTQDEELKVFAPKVLDWKDAIDYFYSTGICKEIK